MREEIAVPTRREIMDDIADAILRRGLARDQRLRPEPGHKSSGDDRRAKTDGRPMEYCYERQGKNVCHGVRGRVRLRFLLSSSIASSCRRSSFAMGSLSALRSRVGVASMALPTEMTARSGGCGRALSVRSSS